MSHDLTPEQIHFRDAARSFAAQELASEADRIDEQEAIPAVLLRRIAAEGYLGAIVPPSHGGLGLDMISFGLLCESFGYVCSSARSLLTVQSMVTQAITRWGSRQQRLEWLPRLAKGEAVAAFALTEPNVGSDAGHPETEARAQDDTFLLTGCKRWISFAQIADLFLVVARLRGDAAAFLVEKSSPGLTIQPMNGLLGCRGSMLGELRFDDCRVPRANLIGGAKFGFSLVASTALDVGRYSVAWGCVGMAQGCLDAALRYASRRKQFGEYLKNHQLVQRLLTEMTADVKAARCLCLRAGAMRDRSDPEAVVETSIAKYFSARAAMNVAGHAVQIHGANGCAPGYTVDRFFRDAKIMEIIEGSNQILQVSIARQVCQTFEEAEKKPREAGQCPT